MPKDSRLIEWPMKVIGSKSRKFGLEKVADFSDFITTENKVNLKSLKLTILTTNRFNHVFPHKETRSIPILFFPTLFSPRGIFDQKMRKIEEDVF